MCLDEDVAFDDTFTTTTHDTTGIRRFLALKSPRFDSFSLTASGFDQPGLGGSSDMVQSLLDGNGIMLSTLRLDKSYLSDGRHGWPPWMVPLYWIRDSWCRMDNGPMQDHIVATILNIQLLGLMDRGHGFRLTTIPLTVFTTCRTNGGCQIAHSQYVRDYRVTDCTAYTSVQVLGRVMKLIGFFPFFSFSSSVLEDMDLRSDSTNQAKAVFLDQDNPY